MTRTILVNKRSLVDLHYNSVAVLMGDDDIVLVSLISYEAYEYDSSISLIAHYE